MTEYEGESSLKLLTQINSLFYELPWSGCFAIATERVVMQLPFAAASKQKVGQLLLRLTIRNEKQVLGTNVDIVA